MTDSSSLPSSMERIERMRSNTSPTAASMADVDSGAGTSSHNGARATVQRTEIFWLRCRSSNGPEPNGSPSMVKSSTIVASDSTNSRLSSAWRTRMPRGVWYMVGSTYDETCTSAMTDLMLYFHSVRWHLLSPRRRASTTRPSMRTRPREVGGHASGTPLPAGSRDFTVARAREDFFSLSCAVDTD